MPQTAFLTLVFFLLSITVKAQPALQPGYLTNVPPKMKSCGALYTYDTVALQKKKYLLAVDFQDKGVIVIGGKAISLQLTDTKNVRQTNILTYKGAGYTVVLSYTTTGHKGEQELETGTLQIINGAKKLTIKIHGQSGCDESGQEGNG